MSKVDLDYHAHHLFEVFKRARRVSSNEFELRLHVEPEIRKSLNDLYGISLEQIRSERHNSAGRFDTAYGGVVVEYEWDMGVSGRRHGAYQAIDYLRAERERLGAESMFSAVVVDSSQWGFLISDEVFDSQASLFGIQPEGPEDRFVWGPNSPEACRRFLQLVGSNPKAAVSGETLSTTFGIGSSLARHVVTTLLEVLKVRKRGGRSDILYEEWFRALEVAYGKLDDSSKGTEQIAEELEINWRGTLGELIFALHTFFALVSRLIALEILAISVGDHTARPSGWSAISAREFAVQIRRFERGLLPNQVVVSNILEGDVFSWYLETLDDDLQLLEALRGICQALSGFAFPRLAYGAGPATDLFRDLYQRLTSRRLRKALGEFLTPPWLAQATLEAAKRGGEDLRKVRVLDCTCGTGTFLYPVVLARLREVRRKEPDLRLVDIQAVLNDVVGIDINPVAVLAARMNYLIALGDLAGLGGLTIPIWLADSILHPLETERQRSLTQHPDYPELLDRDYVELETSLDEPFVIPRECLSQAALARIAEIVRATLLAGQGDDDFSARVEKELGPSSQRAITRDPQEWENARGVLLVLFRQIHRLEELGQDGIWAEIIENRFAPLFLPQFDVVVGNPPWLTYTKLPAGWRSRAEPRWRDYGLYEAPRIPGVDEPPSLQTSDIAVLVLAVAVEKYLKPGGVLSFLMPKSVISGDPGNRAFRTYSLESSRDPQSRREVSLPFRLLEINDFEEVKPFSPDATNSPIILTLRSHATNTFPVAGKRWRRRQPGLRIPERPWSVIESGYLQGETVRWEPISSYSASPLAWWREGEESVQGEFSNYRYGKGFDTRGANGVLFLELLSSVDSRGKIRVRNRPALGRDQRLKDKGAHVGEVDAELVVPVVRGRDVNPFHAEASEVYLLLAHEPDARSYSLSKERLRDFPSTAAFLNYFRDSLVRRSPYMSFKPSEESWWGVQGVDHMDEGFLVCVPEIKKPLVAAVVRARWDERLGRTVLPVPDHKIVFFNTSSELEAHYLVGMINSCALQDLISRYGSFTSISPATLRYLPIPSFSSGNKQQCYIAERAIEVHSSSDAQARSQAVKGLDELAADLLRAERRI